jgi:hypothetical protein
MPSIEVIAHSCGAGLIVFLACGHRYEYCLSGNELEDFMRKYKYKKISLLHAVKKACFQWRKDNGEWVAHDNENNA